MSINRSAVTCSTRVEGCVTVRHHLDGGITISQEARLFATFTATGEPVDAAAPVEQSTCQTEADRSLVNNTSPAKSLDRTKAVFHKYNLINHLN